MAKRKTIGQRILNRLGVTVIRNEQLRRRVREAYASGYDDGNDDPATSALAARGHGYKITSGGAREPSISWEENLKTAWDLKQSNPLVDRMGEIRRDYIIGQGIAPKAVDPDLQTILDDFWKANEMLAFTSELARQWGDYGAQCVPAYTRLSDGRVSLGYIDPDLIERVIAHPGNSRAMWAVVIKEQRGAVTDSWVPDVGTQVYKVVRPAERIVVDQEQEFTIGESEESLRFLPRIIEARWRNPNNGADEDITGKLATAAQSPRAPWEIVMLKSYGLDDYSGDCFLIRKNADSNQPLGRSDHLQAADFCDQHDAAMFALGQQEELKNMIFADVAVDGDEDKVRERAREIRERPPTPGSVNVHNLSETWNLNAPNMQQAGSVTTVDAQRKLVLGGEGIPDAWYGAPGGTHLATVTAQGDPTWRTLVHDQGRIQSWLIKMLEFVRDQALIAGHYRPQPVVDENGEVVPADMSVALPMPEMTVRDIAGLSAALSSVVGAMSMAVAEGFASKENAIDAVAKVLTEMDVHPDVDELKDAIVDEEQGTLLGAGGDDGAGFNLRSWKATHAALSEE